MIRKIKWIDRSMLTLFVLWLATVDFGNLTTLNMVAGVAVIGYLCFYAARHYGDGAK
jgi:hypothetical protein